MAIWYIDPTTASESDAYDGGYGSGKLRDRYSDVSGLAAGDAIYFRSGTTHPGRCTLSTSGSAAAYITVGKYGGSARAIIDAQGGTNGSAAFLVLSASYVRISGLHGKNHTASAGSGVGTLRASYVEITDCEGSGCQMGIAARQDQAATVGNITIRGNYVHNNTFCGIYIEAGTISNALIGDVDIESNLVEGNGFTALTTYPNGGIYAWSMNRSTVDATRAPFGIRVRRNNKVRNNSGYGISYDCVFAGGRGNEIVNNEVTGQSPGQDTDTHCIWVGGSQSVWISGNDVHDNYGYANQSSGSGVGIFVDQYQDGSPSSGCRVVSNKIYNQWQGASSAKFASAAIAFFHAQDCLASGNFVLRCRNGVVAIGDNSNNTERIRITNNTCVEIDEVAFGASYKADGITYRNNIAVNSATGFFAETGAAAVLNIDRDYGIAFECDEAWAEGTLSAQVAGTAGSNDSEDDPLLDARYRPRAGSPVIGAGTYLYNARHMSGKRMSPVRPDIGAYQYTEPRAIVLTRAV